ncbi:MAG TPA: WG repeat-containing protein [Oscillatoriales cyanobacterium M4454_W2019_049]|nr:WG repeat-containing protein [Oscillatoriales cyanobacterium M4454_W2019_049]
MTVAKRSGDLPLWRLELTRGGKWGYIDRTGEFVIPPHFNCAFDFTEGLAGAISGKWGFIDRTGEFVIPPQFRRVRPFAEGLAPVCLKGYGWGAIDRTGQWVVPPQFENIDMFSEGLAVASFKGKKGYIDRTGRWVIPPQFEWAWKFSEGLAKVMFSFESSRLDCYGWIDRTGKLIIPPGSYFYPDFTRGDFKQGLAIVQHILPQVKSWEYGYIGDDGHFRIQPQFDRGKDFSEGLAAVAEIKIYPLWRFLIHGLQKLFLKHQTSSSFGIETFWGYIDPTGHLAIAHQFDDAKEFSEGLAAVKQGSKWGYIDRTGKLVIPYQFDDAGGFRNGLAVVWLHDRMHYIDRTGHIVTLRD